MTTPLLALFLCALPLQDAGAGDAPRPAPVEEPSPRAGPLSREEVLGRLAEIERAARLLSESAKTEEGRAMAANIAELAGSLGRDIRAPVAAAAAPAEAVPPGALRTNVPPKSQRADPSRFRPVQTRSRQFSKFGVNPVDLPPGGTTGRTFRGVHFSAVSKGGAVMATFPRAHRRFGFRDCVFEGVAGDDGKIRTRWGIRAYDVIDWEFEHCEWRQIPGEHGCYLSAPGSVTWRNCRFQNIGSQAIQVVYRTGGKSAHETSDPRLVNLGGLQLVQECVISEVGQPTGGRPSYALSFFQGPKTKVRIESCFIQTLNSPHLDHEGMPARSYGAIMVHERPRVEIVNNYVNYAQPDRDVIQIWNCDEVIIEGCEIVSGRIELRNCKRVRVAGNTGGATLLVGTGPRNVWPLPNVRHEAPVSMDYEHE